MVLHLFMVFSQSVANNVFFLNQGVDSIVWTLFTSVSLESGLSCIVHHRFICLTPKTWTPCKACEVLLWAWCRQNFPTDWLHNISFPSSKNYDCVTENEFPDAKERQVYNRTKPHLNIGTIGHVDHGHLVKRVLRIRPVAAAEETSSAWEANGELSWLPTDGSEMCWIMFRTKDMLKEWQINVGAGCMPWRIQSHPKPWSIPLFGPNHHEKSICIHLCLGWLPMSWFCMNISVASGDGCPQVGVV